MAQPGRMVNVGLVSPPLFVSLSSCRWSAANTPAAAPFVRQFSLAWPAFTFPLSSLGLSSRQLLSNDSALAINHPDLGGGLRKFHPWVWKTVMSTPRDTKRVQSFQNRSYSTRKRARRANFACFDALTRDDGQTQFEKRSIRKAIRFFRRTLDFIRNTTSPNVMKQLIIR